MIKKIISLFTVVLSFVNGKGGFSGKKNNPKEESHEDFAKKVLNDKDGLSPTFQRFMDKIIKLEKFRKRTEQDLLRQDSKLRGTGKILRKIKWEKAKLERFNHNYGTTP